VVCVSRAYTDRARAVVEPPAAINSPPRPAAAAASAARHLPPPRDRQAAPPPAAMSVAADAASSPRDDDAYSRFVRLCGGRAPIRKVLIANNGIAAVKAIRSIRVWAYETFGDEHAVEFVAMATPEDVTANAEYVRMADMWTAVAGGSNNHNFANVDLIADIADRYGCDAVWAGWGHASENPALPRKLASLDIAFMGPPGDSMHALGDKIASTIIAQSAGVPTVAWSGQGLTVDYKKLGCVPDDLYASACVETEEDLVRVADVCGFPVVIKASEGGGGKGIRVVFDKPALQPAFRQVKGEIPGSPIFVMRLVKNARHLEVQIVADEYGNAVALHGRDCSIQRRHQKIIEEGPVVAAPPHVWKKLERGAVALAKAVGYVGAGTVEYLYTGDETGGEFYFLELNPRLQVEHPVTEWISRINLPALQLHIAMGIPLQNVSCIRRFFGVPDKLLLDHDVLSSSSASAPSSPPTGTGTNGDATDGKDTEEDDGAVDRETARRIGSELFDRDPLPPRGHVIACRITAENPDEGFQPTSGAIQELMFRNTPNVWGYFSVGSSGGVHEFADSQFGHLFAWGENREASRRSLVLALKELSIRGDIRTTVEYIIKLLEMPDFRNNKIHTAWLDALIAEKVTAERPPNDLAVIIGAVCRAHIDFNSRADAFTKCLERGQLPMLDRSLVEFPVELIYDDIKYCLRMTRAGESTFRVRLQLPDVGVGAAATTDNHSVVADVRNLADGGVLVLVDGRSHVCYAREEPAGMRLSIDGKTVLSPHEYDPETLTANVSGKLVRYLVEDNDHVEKDDAYAELEVMKMYLTLRAPESGTISLVKPAGSGLEIGDVVARLELDDPSKVRRAELFQGSLPRYGPPQAPGSKPHQIFNAARNTVELLLRGFDADSMALGRLVELIDDPRVAAGELQEALSSLSGRIPAEAQRTVASAIDLILNNCEVLDSGLDVGGGSGRGMNSSSSLAECVEETGGDTSRVSSVKLLYRTFDLSHVATAVFTIKKCLHDLPQASALLTVAAKYENGSVLAPTICSLLDLYLEVERPFARSSNSAGDVLFEMRDENRSDLGSLVEVAVSHLQLKAKTEMMVAFLKVLSDPAVTRKLSDDSPQSIEVKARLHQMSQLFAPAYADLALRARIMLADFNRPHFRQRHSTVAKLLAEAAAVAPAERAERIQNIVGLSESILDVLVTFVLPQDDAMVPVEVRRIAAEVQLLRSYRAYDVSQFIVAIDESEASSLMATWRFRFSKRDDASLMNQSSGPLPATSLNAPPGMAPAAFVRSSNLQGIPSGTRGMLSFDSADNLAASPGGRLVSVVDPDPYRYGALAAFASLAEMEQMFDSAFQKCTSQIEAVPGLDINVMTVLLRWDVTSQTPVSSPSLLDGKLPTDLMDPLAFEEHVSHTLGDFCRAKQSRLDHSLSAGIKTITFIVVPAASGQSVTYPGFYTYRVRNNFKEDPIFRQIDPPMAFQLELARLSNFDITRFGYPNRSIHVFFAQDKAAKRRRTGTPPKCPSTGSAAATDVPAAQAEGTAPASVMGSLNMDIVSQAKSSPSMRLPPVSPPGLSQTASTSALDESGKEPPPPSSLASPRTSRGERDVDARFFVRAVIRHVDVFSSANDAVVTIPEAERTFVEALDAVEMASCDRRFRRTDCNHIFINVIPTVRIDVEDIQKICKRMFMRYAQRCWLLRVFVVEVKVSTFSSEGTGSAAFLPLRFLLFNPTGHVLRVESYLESTDPGSGNVRIMSLSRREQGSLHGTMVSEPYQIMDRIQRNRVIAKTLETVYVYDFIQLFAKQLQSRWRQYSEDRLLGGFRRNKVPPVCLVATELILRESSEGKGETTLVPTDRSPGLNEIGMVAWRCKMFTPECPTGREIIIIANDITFRSGSFGPEEDNLFLAASQLARREGVPRIYLAANAGARIGIADEIRDRLQVSWLDPEDPLKGFSCLAILSQDMAVVGDAVTTGREIAPGLHEVTTIVGASHGLGVENLMGSGLIAGESSQAYDEIFTLTYVTARSVGIGAYLVRLGQRVIQKETAAPIILTGYSALNKVLGHEVYGSNDQLGGTKIMHPNGVTHTVVQDDVQGVGAILDWLSFVPVARGQPLPVIESRDPVTRNIRNAPPADGQPYDPRLKLLAGEKMDDRRDGGFLCGFFDKYSWRETLEGWAKTVVVGRARLGGVPTAVIAVETRSMERVSPADPASPETHESIVLQAGQVWYPDSAAKTAQAIKDFDREGLPLFVFANWRGFSGGMRDMFDEVLKAGSDIVDALRAYKQPVFVYIPPGGELRGGAWVVLDTLINPEQIEMYADSTARGGILEPEGTVDVKYRRRELLKTMHRLDPVLQKLDKEVAACEALPGMTSEDEKRALLDSIYVREVEVLPAYKNVATSFCDLHDTPGRLLAKGAIRKIVAWETARIFFYWRLQRRLSEERIRNMCKAANPKLSHDQITTLFRKWADADRSLEAETALEGQPPSSSGGQLSADGSNLQGDPETSVFDEDDSWVFQWFENEEDAIVRRISKIRVSRIAEEVGELCQESAEGFLEGIENALRACGDDGERAKLASAIQTRVELASSQGSPSTTGRSILPPSLLSRLRVGFDPLLR
jgi:biotin carboxylase/acetyl-CoA carboxylase carboxyltransferase component/biotin carboxyl carrier protein